MDRRRFLLTSLAGALGVLLAAGAPPVLAQDAYVNVEGQVRRPGAVKYKSGMTVSEAIGLAGGFAATASFRDVHLIRGGKSTRVELRDVPVYPRPLDPELRPGDVVQVGGRFF